MVSPCMSPWNCDLRLIEWLIDMRRNWSELVLDIYVEALPSLSILFTKIMSECVSDACRNANWFDVFNYMSSDPIDGRSRKHCNSRDLTVPLISRWIRFFLCIIRAYGNDRSNYFMIIREIMKSITWAIPIGKYHFNHLETCWFSFPVDGRWCLSFPVLMFRFCFGCCLFSAASLPTFDFSPWQDHSLWCYCSFCPVSTYAMYSWPSARVLLMYRSGLGLGEISALHRGGDRVEDVMALHC